MYSIFLVTLVPIFGVPTSPSKGFTETQFFKNRGKTNVLVELIDRRKKWVLENEGKSSDDDEEEQPKKQENNGPDWEWDDTIKQAPDGFERTPPPCPAVAWKISEIHQRRPGPPIPQSTQVSI
eukprot:TRINITY_DN1710_c0_g1_i4.p2 TRINITY_DN1710_c0_g1~~TRINITY_DN1710_c0_g1_i4.p2  ORF type:complete len:123 (+),score=29.05 TRINITY_DN1710_c0_g1_i4:251-619(+)